MMLRYLNGAAAAADETGLLEQPGGDESAPLATYVVVPARIMAPAAEVLAQCGGSLPDWGPVHLCRELALDVSPGDVPPPPAAPRDGERRVEESWATSIGWLAKALDHPAIATLAARLVVRARWPSDADAEAALLLARLSAPELRIAIEIDASNAEDVFHYFNRFGFAWLAVPKPAVADEGTAEALTRLCRLWCFDPRTTTPLEPIRTALAMVVAERRRRSARRWRCRVVAAGGATVVSSCDWTPSTHAALMAHPQRAMTLPLDGLRALDQQWVRELSALCAGLEPDPLHALARPHASVREHGIP